MQQGKRFAFAIQRRARDLDKTIVQVETHGLWILLVHVDPQGVVAGAYEVQQLATDAQDSGERSYWGKGHELLIADFHARLTDPEPFWIDLASGIAPLRVLREVYRQSGLLAGQQL